MMLQLVRSKLLLLVLALLLPTTISGEKLIKSSALLTCMDNSAFTASTFDVMMFPANLSVNVGVSATSTIEGNITVNVKIIAYGITVVQENVDPCTVKELSHFCPMQSGHMDLIATIKISDDLLKKIPGIAYTIPDLDGIVKITVYPRGDTKNPVACVEATLSNGKTVQTKWASWGIGIVCLLGLLTAGCAAIAGHTSTSAHIASNVVSLFTYFQAVAIVSMMAVQRLPPIAAAWAQNFQWTMGIMRVKFLQDIFSWYVQSTGGTALNILPNKNTLSVEVQKRDITGIIPQYGQYSSEIEHLNTRRELYRRMIELPRLLARDSSSSTGSTNTNITTMNEADPNIRSKTLILRGMQRVAYLAEVELSNLFLTGLVFFMILACFSVIFMALVKGILELLARTGTMDNSRFTDYRQGWTSFCKGFLFRLTLIAFTQLSVLCLFEFTRHDSAGTIVMALISYIAVLAVMGFAAYKVITTARMSTMLYKNPAYILYSDNAILQRWGFLYVQFRASAYYFILAVFGHSLLRAIFVGLIQSEGKAQAMGLFLIELGYLVLLSWIKPYMDKATNAFNIGITAITFINTIFFLFFSNIFGQPQVVSSVAAVVFFVLNAVLSLVLLILIIFSICWFIFSKNPDNRYQPMRDDRLTFMKDSNGIESSQQPTELDALGATATGDPFQTEQFRRSMISGMDDDDDSIRKPSSNQFLDPHHAGYSTLGANQLSSSEFPRTRIAPNDRYRSNGPFDQSNDKNSSNSSLSQDYYSDSMKPPIAASPYRGYSYGEDTNHVRRQPPQW